MQNATSSVPMTILCEAVVRALVFECSSGPSGIPFALDAILGVACLLHLTSKPDWPISLQPVYFQCAQEHALCPGTIGALMAEALNSFYHWIVDHLLSIKPTSSVHDPANSEWAVA